ncbi:KRI1-like family C-terminal-domain-containing protein [Gymnopilus junonius]|uniref:KRI1-like family C-terminal-domain-containing protein n=1 Tax=Gymnopilus junonius TaxID=109634 RepID=A0A9P5P292_GYMJU|nr:KRI1-like family C-terminal-domain-containing protein [Gymnopilus junonius]
MAEPSKIELFSDDERSDEDGEVQLTINEHYAKAFEYKKEREELQRLKEKYGSGYDPDGSESDISTDSESAESEDEHGEELTPAVDAAILRTLARIKKKDPSIYDSQKNIFGEESEKLAAKAPKRVEGKDNQRHGTKPVNIRQANLHAIALRRETIAAFHGAVAGVEGDDFLVPREKTQDEREREEEEYRAFLEREVGNLKDLVSVDGHSDGEELQEKGEEEKEGARTARRKRRRNQKGRGAEEDQEFLLNYIMNRGWIDPDPQDDDSNGEEGGDENEELDTGMLSDTSFESIASYFEASYNHRFEEPGADTIPTFPRNLPSLVRRPDTTRKEARERKKTRKEEEIQKKREEVKRLKALKMREVKRKLEMISKQGGLKAKHMEGEDDEFVDEALRELDLEGEWDPEKHDRQMAGLFERGADAFEEEFDYEGGEEEEYYDDVKLDEDGKPLWDDDIDIGDIPISDDDAFPVETKRSKKEKKKKKKKKGREGDDGAVDIDAMDADVQLAPEDYEEWDGTEEMRKRVFNKYMDEIYGLEFNDMIGDLPTRFKYVPIPAQDFALAPAEILMATDQELNEYMSVKKYAPYRQDKGNKHKYHKKTQEKLWELKAKIAERSRKAFGVDVGGGTGANSIGVPTRGGGAGDEEAPKKRRKGKKERMKLKASKATGEGEGEDEDDDGDVDVDMQEVPSTTATVAEGVDSKKSKKRKREHEQEQGKDKNRVEEDTNTADGVHVNVTGTGEGEEGAAKKKRKKRHRKKDGESVSVVAAQA